MTSSSIDNPLKLTVFAFDVPFPAHRGGRADIWRRLVALKALGSKLQLVCWQNSDSIPPSTEDLSVICSIVEDLHIFPLHQGGLEPLKRIAMLPLWPSHVLARRLTSTQMPALMKAVRAFDPDAIWIEGPYPGLAGERVAYAVGVPYFYRSHNIEHLYMARQAKAARALSKRISWSLACIGLKGYETRLMRNARHVYDISTDDMLFWRTLGIERISCLPPLPERAISGNPFSDSTSPLRDIVFLGNLSTPNNVRGVEFLLTEVAPILLMIRPETRITIVGSHPTDHIRQIVAKSRCADLLENVPDAGSVLDSARVLVNPVRTGSGVMVKILDMLMTDAPIVSTKQGASGLPDIVKDQLIIVDDASSFAREIVQALSNPNMHPVDRTAARATFSIDRIEALRDEIRAMIAS
ncbi:glycosyltransferase [Comamonadaceae bacterium G21597-S1]|nr:glycosyltransferase [Comamonadaceae bacterium G21597-S1]